jgi:saposin
MNRSFFLIVLVAVLFGAVASAHAVKGDAECGLCKLVTGELEKIISSPKTEEQILHEVEKICTLLPTKLQQPCNGMIDDYGLAIINLLLSKETPDVICEQLSLCPKKLEASLECPICELVMQEVEKLVASETGETKIEEALDKVCGLLPTSAAGFCGELVSAYLPEIVEWIEKKETPEVICQQIGICAATVSHVDSPLECSICELVMTEVEKLIASNYTEEKIIEVLDKVCDVLPSQLQSVCEELVANYLPVLIELFENKESPDVICQQIGVCTKNLVTKVEAVDCKLCLFVVTEAEKILADPKTEGKIEELLDKVCAALPDYISGECQTLVTQFLPNIIELLEAKETPEVVCNQLGLCSQMNKDRQPKNSHVYSSVECALCELVMTEVEKLLASNFTESKIEEVLDKVCGYLPSALQSPCQELINQYLPELIELLESKETPEVVCQQIGLCTSTLKVRGSTECALCQIVMTEVERLLASNFTESKIEEVLDSVCSYLPELLQEPCDNLVNQYLPELIELLESKETPEVVCEQISLCATSRPSDIRLGDTTECALCKFVMTEVEALLAGEWTESKIEEVLDKVCGYLPSALQSPCQELINQYLPELIELLESKETPEVVCQQISLCTASVGCGVSGSVGCGFCKEVVQFVDKILADNRTVERIEEVLSDVCTVVPEQYKAECGTIVKTYFPILVYYLEKEASAQEVCQVIGLCTASMRNEKWKHPGKKEGKCFMCHTVLDVVAHAAQEGMLEDGDDIRSAVCDAFPKRHQRPCRRFVKHHGALIHQVMESGSNDISLCARFCE